MLDASWLTVTEIARRLGRPPSTVRYWRSAYRDVLDERTDEDGHRVYRLATFEHIDRLLRARVAPGEIRRALTEDGDAASPEDLGALLLRELRAIREAVERIADHLDHRREEE